MQSRLEILPVGLPQRSPRQFAQHIVPKNVVSANDDLASIAPPSFKHFPRFSIKLALESYFGADNVDELAEKAFGDLPFLLRERFHDGLLYERVGRQRQLGDVLIHSSQSRSSGKTEQNAEE